MFSRSEIRVDDKVFADIVAARNVFGLDEDYEFRGRYDYCKHTLPFPDKQEYAYSCNEVFSKWGKINEAVLRFHPNVHRVIMKNEIVFDCDSDKYSDSAASAFCVATELERRTIPFNAFYSGNRGVHIHAFFNITEIEDQTRAKFEMEFEQNPKAFEQLRAFAFTDIYLSVKRYVKDIDLGLGKSSRHVIRECGSINEKSGYMKTYIGSTPKEILNSIRPICEPTGQAPVFPQSVEMWELPKQIITKWLDRPKPKQFDLAAFMEHQIKDDEYNNFCKRLLSTEVKDKRKRGCFVLAGFFRANGKTKEEAIDALETWTNGAISRGYITATVESVYKSELIPTMGYIRDNFSELIEG